MQPTEQDIIKAYNIAKETGSDSTCKVLEALFPDVDFTPKDNRPVEERIKTFEDACEALGDDHTFVIAYKDYVSYIYEHDRDDYDFDLVAYLKLRIITAALNEGWEPQFAKDEERWYPWYHFYTYEELAEKSEEWKASRTILDINDRRCVGRSNYYSNAYVGLVYAYAYNTSSYSDASYGSRLAFKSEALANYAGKQFIKIYADMNIGSNI